MCTSRRQQAYYILRMVILRMVKLRLRRPTVAMAPKPPSREARRIAAKELDMVVPSRFRAAASVLTLSQACSSVLVYMIFAI